ncbi:DUF2939 domain-containing protein [Novosphingobium sp. KA1]|uniref:DUF2939 domain-containing protein n=1 Tax=Novosphingobium sp. (strain KA1) TaxID=164608 RepID=UPI001A8C706D|nr:DUF2939 domain-containing protein [Novosphingobium sp. KA1]QSR15642.1 hypothetical protein CA833_00205 [Novosphingobium sp. KA1]
MKKVILAGVAAIAIAAGGWYWLSPGMAMKGLRDAALAGDKDELRERVDFPAVRESLKSQMRAVMVAEMAKEKDTPFAAMGMAFAGAIIDPMIDGVVSPDGIKVMVQSGKMKDPDKPVADQTKGGETEWAIERRGLDRFIAKPKVADGEKAPSLVFKRDGLGWELVDIEAPIVEPPHDVGA